MTNEQRVFEEQKNIQDSLREIFSDKSRRKSFEDFVEQHLGIEKEDLTFFDSSDYRYMGIFDRGIVLASSGKVLAEGNVVVCAFSRAIVEACGDSLVFAFGTARVESIRDNATVYANDTVVIYEAVAGTSVYLSDRARLSKAEKGVNIYSLQSHHP